MPKTFVSNTERRLMLLLMVLITCAYYLNLETKAVDSYNKSVKYEQESRRDLANHPQQGSPSFGIYCSGGVPFWEVLFTFQFFTNPFCCFLLRKACFKRYLISLFFTGLSFICFIFWGLATYAAYQNAEVLSPSELSFNKLLFYGSTRIEFSLFIILAIFIVLQFFILLRFTLERFQAKIYLK